MKKRAKIWAIVFVGMVMGLFAGTANCQDTVSVVALAPKTLYANTPVTVSVTAVTIPDRNPAVVNVAVRFGKDTLTSLLVFEDVTDDRGRLNARFDAPDIMGESLTTTARFSKWTVLTKSWLLKSSSAGCRCSLSRPTNPSTNQARPFRAGSLY